MASGEAAKVAVAITVSEAARKPATQAATQPHMQQGSHPQAVSSEAVTVASGEEAREALRSRAAPSSASYLPVPSNASQPSGLHFRRHHSNTYTPLVPVQQLRFKRWKQTLEKQSYEMRPRLL